MSKTSIKFNASDVLGALALEAKRIVMAADHFAAGAIFPSGMQMKTVIERMVELNDVIVDFERVQIAMETEARANESLVSKGTNAVN